MGQPSKNGSPRAPERDRISINPNRCGINELVNRGLITVPAKGT